MGSGGSVGIVKGVEDNSFGDVVMWVEGVDGDMRGVVIDLGDGSDVFECVSGKVCICMDVSMVIRRLKERGGGVL